MSWQICAYGKSTCKRSLSDLDLSQLATLHWHILHSLFIPFCIASYVEYLKLRLDIFPRMYFCLTTITRRQIRFWLLLFGVLDLLQFWSGCKYKIWMRLFQFYPHTSVHTVVSRRDHRSQVSAYSYLIHKGSLERACQATKRFYPNLTAVDKDKSGCIY